MFLYIDPLKQGLKLSSSALQAGLVLVFIHRSIKTRIETNIVITRFFQFIHVFIHRSIKTRIETFNRQHDTLNDDMFLFIDPLKQGLKQEVVERITLSQFSFYT